jgi:hypothetical protein
MENFPIARGSEAGLLIGSWLHKRVAPQECFFLNNYPKKIRSVQQPSVVE